MIKEVINYLLTAYIQFCKYNLLKMYFLATFNPRSRAYYTLLQSTLSEAQQSMLTLRADKSRLLLVSGVSGSQLSKQEEHRAKICHLKMALKVKAVNRSKWHVLSVLTCSLFFIALKTLNLSYGLSVSSLTIKGSIQYDSVLHTLNLLIQFLPSDLCVHSY